MKSKKHVSDALERILLFFLNGEEYFKARYKKFIRPRLDKGLPSLFRLLKPLYYTDLTSNGGEAEQKERISLMESALLELETELTSADNTFEGKAEMPNSPTTLLFLYQYLAEHYNLLGNSEKAMVYVDKAIVFGQTLPELFTLKGKVCKHSGDLFAAAEAYEEARRLDLADRYLNTR